MCSFFECIFACLCPPIAVLIRKGCKCDLLLNVFLTLLGWFPGCIHAYCVICREEPQYMPGVAQTVVNINPQPVYQQPQQAFHYPPPPQQPFLGTASGQAMYPMPSQHQHMSAPPAYVDNPSAPKPDYPQFGEKFNE